jgi:hypothetical protein
MKRITVENLLLRAATALRGLRPSLTLSGGGDTLCLRTGNPIGGARPGPHGFGFLPTLCYIHTSWNLGVGMELAGDTKPTIASRVFAAHFDFRSAGSAAGRAHAVEGGCADGCFLV